MSGDQRDSKLWGGRFAQATDPFVEGFTASVHFDRRLYPHDIKGSLAHAEALHRAGLLADEEHRAITTTLQALREQMDAGSFNWSPQLEDVHMNIEAALTEAIGDAGKKLHTGRSRNDQVATAMRLYLRAENSRLIELLKAVQEQLLELAEREAATLMPGFTHLQPAQPVTFGHHMLAWFEMLDRDRHRLLDCGRRLNQSPLGAAALAGTPHPVDRELTARLLGFDQCCENSMDAVSDRDFITEFCFAGSLLMTHLSRFSEELVLWMSPAFGFVDLADRFCTGSSIMPQKKNPDIPELVRGKQGRVTGNLMALLCLMKSQPLTYNRDNQEDKERLFDTVDTVSDCLQAYRTMLPGLVVRRERLLEAAREGYGTATDLADYLVARGLPFRDAHRVTGQAVAHAMERRLELAELSLEDLQAFSTLIEEDVFERLTVEGSASSRDHWGGTAPNQVRKAVERGRTRLKSSPGEPQNSS